MTYRLEMSGVTKRFGGTLALHEVDLRVGPGEIRGLIGENGSGKSTTMKVLSGEVAPDDGSVVVDGAVLPPLDPMARLRAGVGIVMQDPHLCEQLSVAENLWLGRLAQRRQPVRWKKVRALAAEVLERAGIPIDPEAKVADLSQDEQHMVEVARVLAWDCKVIGFDETTASLTEDHVARLFQIMRRLRADGASMVFISHRLPEVLEICDTITVLRDGEVVDTVEAAKVTTDELVRMMVGRSLAGLHRRTPHRPGDVVLDVSAMTPARFPAPVEFQVRAGEVVGLGGLVGSGRSSVLEAVYGLRPRSGTVTVGEVEVPPNDPRAAIRSGMGFVPEDRRTRGLAMAQSVRANAAMVLYGARPLARRVDTTTERAIVQTLFDRIALKAADSEVPVSTLSGGNQQKIVLGRWLEHRPALLLLDEPTRGIDVGAKQEIYRLIDELAGEGVAILLVSSELPELIGVCDRILMLREGHITAEFGHDPSEEELMAAAAHTAGSLPSDRRSSLETHEELT